MNRPPIALPLALVLGGTLLLIVPELARAHSAGPLDVYGCHPDRRKGGYHCHTGKYAGVSFSSKAEMLEKRKAGVTGDQLRAEQAAARKAAGKSDGFWPSWVPFLGKKKSKESEEPTTASAGSEAEAAAATVNQPAGKRSADAASGGDAAPPRVVEGTGRKPIVPQGIEERLAVLKGLHDKGLITDAEYADKKAEILGSL
jgi:hypothetical protein